MPLTSIGPNSVAACSSRCRAFATKSGGRRKAGGNSARTAFSRLASDASRGCSPDRASRSMPARHALRSVSAAAPTKPGRLLIASSSPSCVPGKAAWVAARRLSSSMARSKPPASRAASGSNAMACKAVRAVSSRLQHGIPHREAAVHDGGPAPGRAGSSLFGHAVSVHGAANRVARARCRAVRRLLNPDPTRFALCSELCRGIAATSPANGRKSDFLQPMPRTRA